MLQSVFGADEYLRGQSLSLCVHRSAHHGRKTGVDERLATNDNEHSGPPDVTSRPSYTVQLSPSHRVTWTAASDINVQQRSLVFQDVLSLGVEHIRLSIQKRPIPGLHRIESPTMEKRSQDSFDER